MTSAARRSVSWTRPPYTSRVMLLVAWPRRALTAGSGTPWSSSQVAQVVEAGGLRQVGGDAGPLEAAGGRLRPPRLGPVRLVGEDEGVAGQRDPDRHRRVEGGGVVVPEVLHRPRVDVHEPGVTALQPRLDEELVSRPHDGVPQ